MNAPTQEVATQSSVTTVKKSNKKLFIILAIIGIVGALLVICAAVAIMFAARPTTQTPSQNSNDTSALPPTSEQLPGNDEPKETAQRTKKFEGTYVKATIPE